MASVQDILAKHTVGKDGKSVQWSSISGPGKHIGLYFSAHWCPPCRGFTPKLAEFYKQMKATDTGKNFEIVFVSSDRDQASFDEYYGEMPWLALSYEARDEKNDLSKKFGVRGIPTFVILNGENCETITTKGREKVMSDPEAKDFPWHPKSFADILYSGDFITNDGKTVVASEVKSKIKGVYFSAHWCPPCRGFTPKLVDTYNKLKEKGKPFEIIFASSDQDESAFKEYFSGMPWLSLPYKDPRKEELSELCEVEGIPTFVIYDENDSKITFDGRSAVSSDPEGNDFPWLPKPLNALNENTAASLNEKPCLIYFTDGDEKEVAKAKEILQPIAEKEFNPDQEAQKLLFFYTDEDDDLVDSLKTFTKLQTKSPFVAIVDIPSRELVELSGDISDKSVAEFVEGYISGKLERKSF